MPELRNRTLSDGRRVEYLVAGAADGPAVVAHHGTPSEAGFWRAWHQAAQELGLRLVSVTRPGYAGSARKKGRRVADAAADVREVLDGLGIGSFAAVGWSGGGPHALACAALLPERCRAAASLAGAAPFGLPELDFLDGMGAENVREFDAAARGEGPLADFMIGENAPLRDISPESLVAAFGSLLPPVDKEALTGALIEGLAATIRSALRDGFDGQIDDDLAFVGDWGFEVGSVRVPTLVWQGGLDKMVPPAHGRWLAERLPACSSRLEPGQGHLSIWVGREREILGALARHL